MGRLGWIDGYGFSPYEENLVFDGEETFRTRFERFRRKAAVRHGLTVYGLSGLGKRPETWLPALFCAASFASVLVKPCNCLPFFVHLGGGSETGKSLSLVLAASVGSRTRRSAFTSRRSPPRTSARSRAPRSATLSLSSLMSSSLSRTIVRTSTR